MDWMLPLSTAGAIFDGYYRLNIQMLKSIVPQVVGFCIFFPHTRNIMNETYP